MKKRIVLVIAFFIAIMIGIQRVEASTYTGKFAEVWHPDSGFTVFAQETSRVYDYNSWMIKSSIDNKIYYCIEPGALLHESSAGSHNIYYNENDILNNTSLNEEKLKKVRLLAYYGYGYKDAYVDHTDKKWYGITQIMIWRVVRPDLKWIFKESRNATPDTNLYKSEVSELNKLVNNYDVNPSFHSQTHRLLLGTKIKIKDTKKVFYQYAQDGIKKYLEISQNGNELTIFSNHKPSLENIGFKFKPYTNEYFGAFVSPDFQDIIKMGAPNEKYAQLNIEVYGGIVSLQKVDSETEKPITKGEATFKGAVYEVYNESNEKVGKVITDDTGKGSISLDYGTYTFKETKAPKGYNLSKDIYTVDISDNNYNIDLKVSDKVITGKLKILKLKGGSGEEFTSEKDATFEILNNKGEVVDNLKTNKNGIDISVLPYGNYVIKQTSGEDGYVLSDDININIKENKVYEVDIKNLKLSKLDFSKTDYSTSKPVPNTTIEIYKINDEKDELVYKGKTNEHGKITIANLEIGNYYIIEKDAPKYYRINPEKMPFEVKENGKIIKATMQNHRKEGNLEIIKQDKGTKNPLKGALIKLVFMEENKTVLEQKTNKEGKITVPNLIAGLYCIKEEKAPKGYKRLSSKKCFEIKKENEKIKVILENSRKEIKVPNTSSFEIITIIASFIIIISSIYLVRAKKN